VKDLVVLVHSSYMQFMTSYTESGGRRVNNG